VVASWAVFQLKPRWVPMLGAPKTGWSPRIQELRNWIASKVTRVAKGEETESPKACARLKSCESLYMCSRAPFYRETKGLLHSEITLESKEYSQWEHI
jgi:hypothetical protein